MRHKMLIANEVRQRPIPTFRRGAKIGLVAGLILALAGCSGSFTREDSGAIIGATTGAIVGSSVGGGSGRVIASAVGLIIGAAVGSSVGRDLDRADRDRQRQATHKARTAPIGETITWNNPKSGNRGTVKATREGYTTKGSYCREFQQTVIIAGKKEQAYGTACRQPDGSWKVVQR